MSKCPPGCECNTPAEYLPPCSCGCGAGEHEIDLGGEHEIDLGFAFIAGDPPGATTWKWRLATVEDTSIPCPHCYASAGERCEGYCPARDGV